MLPIIVATAFAYIITLHVKNIWLRLLLVIPVAPIASLISTVIAFKVMNSTDANSFGYLVKGVMTNLLLIPVFIGIATWKESRAVKTFPIKQ